MSNEKKIEDLRNNPENFDIDRIQEMTVDEIRGLSRDERNGIPTNKYSDIDRSDQEMSWTDVSR